MLLGEIIRILLCGLLKFNNITMHCVLADADYIKLNRFVVYMYLCLDGIA